MKPEPMLLNCPRCHGVHLDAESHCGSPGVTHLCDRCGWRWAPKETPTVGVTFEELEAHLRARVTELERAAASRRKAWELVEWMAEAYAEGGGAGGPEMRTLADARDLMKEAEVARG